MGVQGYKQQKAYIIAEGPMESTARNMWKMVYNRKCGAIVMLSDLIENGNVRLLFLNVVQILVHISFPFNRRAVSNTGQLWGRRKSLVSTQWT